MILKIIRVNGGIPEKTNCYIIQDENTKETMVIDPGGNPEKSNRDVGYFRGKSKIFIFNTLPWRPYKCIKTSKRCKRWNHINS